jgi:hypothetical protein
LSLGQGSFISAHQQAALVGVVLMEEGKYVWSMRPNERGIHKDRTEHIARTIHEPHGIQRVTKEEDLAPEETQVSAKVRSAQLTTVKGHKHGYARTFYFFLLLGHSPQNLVL